MTKNAPSYPHLTDEYEPTNPALWERVKEVARGDVEELTVGGRTIHRPADKYIWPSPPASAWAVKQYNGFGGNWRRTGMDQQLQILRAGGVASTKTDAEHEGMAKLEAQGLARKAGTSGGYQLWVGGPKLQEDVCTRTYLNEAGFSQYTLDRYAARLNTLLDSLQGWRTKALSGSLKIALVRPQEAPLTAIYRESDDTIYVKASISLLAPDKYGSATYQVLRELGRRYDVLHGCRADFSDPKWQVTKYASDRAQDPRRVFAELFAIGHMGQEGSWDSAIVSTFETMMGAGGRDVSTGLDPATLRDILKTLTKRKVKDFPVHLESFRARAGRDGEWDAEAWIGYEFPKAIPVQEGKKPVLSSLQLVFKYDPSKGVDLVAYAKSPAMGIKRKIYENHRIAGNYERALQAMLLSYQPEIMWK